MRRFIYENRKAGGIQKEPSSVWDEKLRVATQIAVRNGQPLSSAIRGASPQAHRLPHGKSGSPAASPALHQPAALFTRAQRILFLPPVRERDMYAYYSPSACFLQQKFSFFRKTKALSWEKLTFTAASCTIRCCDKVSKSEHPMQKSAGDARWTNTGRTWPRRQIWALLRISNPLAAKKAA